MTREQELVMGRGIWVVLTALPVRLRRCVDDVRITVMPKQELPTVD